MYVTEYLVYHSWWYCVYQVAGKLILLHAQISSKKVDVNTKDGDGATPLHFASSRGHTDVVRWLLSKGARVALDKFGRSPLNDAPENEQLEVHITLIRFLV